MRIIDFLAPDFLENPWPVYARFRADEPVWWSDEIRMYCLFRYADIKGCLTGPDYTVEYPFRVSRAVFGETLLDIDGPKHQRLRMLLMDFLQGKMGQDGFEKIAEEEVARVVGGLADRERLEFITEVAEPLPLRVTLRFVGLPAEDGPWVWERLGYLLAHLDGSRGDFDLVAKRKRELDEYVEPWLRGAAGPSREGEGGPSTTPGTMPSTMIGELRRLMADGVLTWSEALGFVFLTLAAGIETSIAMLSNTMACFLRFPAWMDRVRRDDEGLKAFVREVARWEPPQHDTVRFARTDTELGGRTIERGRPLKLILASGNRDERVFPDGERFDPTRPQRPNLSFGLGPHSCLGQHLALREATALFRALLGRFTAIESATPAIPPIVGSTFRRPAKLELRVRDAARQTASVASVGSAACH